MAPEVIFLAARFSVAFVLYGFLALVLFWLWRDFHSTQRGEAHAPSAHLVLTESKQRFRLRSSSEIGRAAGNVVRIQDETISARHARLMYHGGQWWIEDLASRNGTEVNGIPVDEPLVISYGDKIQLGRVTATLEAGAGQEDNSEPGTLPKSEVK